ncbi:MAG: NAD+ synthase [Xylanivirga thermophila]
MIDLKIAIGQINTKVGDIAGNLSIIKHYIDIVKQKECDLVVFPELALTGYTPKDLLFQSSFIDCVSKAVGELISYTDGISAIISVPIYGENNCLLNATFLIQDRRIIHTIYKERLSKYGDYYEKRYFHAYSKSQQHVINFMGKKIAIIPGLLEDMDCRADIVINISSLPYYRGKFDEQVNYYKRYTCNKQCTLIYINGVGGNDELIFDGNSSVFQDGHMIIKAGLFEEDIIFYDTREIYNNIDSVEEDIQWAYNSLILGLRDYCKKNKIGKIVLGLSGGIDSAVNACIAAEAIGSKNVLGVSMPSRYSSMHSKQDAEQLAKNLDIEYRVIPIEDVFMKYLYIFNTSGKLSQDIAEENIQARIRGNILMFISNREGRLLISSENKSETYVGYSTLYGDMCGGLSVIADIFKKDVYRIAKYINMEEEIIPNNILIKEPSAELKENQKDNDALPPYDVLDNVLYMYLENNDQIDTIINSGINRNTVYNIIDMVYKSEYKRRQSAPALKVSKSSVMANKYMPIAHEWKNNN